MEAAPEAGDAPNGQLAARPDTHLQLTAPALPARPALQPLPDYRGPRIPDASLRSMAITTNPNLVKLRMLILTAGMKDYSLGTARDMLEHAGIPFDVVDATVTALTEETLIDPANGAGRYQGVILTSNALLYQGPAGLASALEPNEWSLLWQYEKTYRVRQVALYTYPSYWPEDYGLRSDGTASDSADVTPAGGQTVTAGLRSGAVIPVRDAWNYPASVAPQSEWAGLSSVQPVLVSAGNPARVFAATSVGTDGREKMALTMSHNEFFLHSQLLEDPVVQWVTRGLYLGNYQRYNQLDVDDWFLPNDHYDAATGDIRPDAFRMSARDALAVRDQQTALQSTYDVARAFRFAMVFNGGGANINAPVSCDPAAPSVDPLTSVSRCLAGTFDWVNHTRDHLYMDFISYSGAYQQIANNRNIGSKLGLVMSKRGLVTGDMSGLGYYNPAGDGDKTNYGLEASNTAFLRAAVDANVAYVASNHSVDGQWDPGCSACGVRHPLNRAILLVPRWPTNIFYYATTPEEITASYNRVYGPGGTRAYWDHALSYQEILDKESDLAVSHMLSGAPFPHYMHTANLREHTPGRSVASDWMNAVLTKYSQYSSLTLNTLTWDQLGTFVQRRTSYAKSSTSAVWNRAARTLTITSQNGGTVYLTGLNGNGTKYVSRNIRTWDFSPNQSLTVQTP
ncbi:hypothetical protein DFI_16315 (plasmid) [Deinococcus ficus]|uniref:Uncharacterized protein n=1 Tax=Deinococcus ficus TaxID=317577 RepID=A0A221T1G7_9DEIO|nr:hypothetical protein DFI_16315 [Deinococcus ficus]